MEWQPIDTAPNSDTDVLLWWEGSVEIGPARYDDGSIVWCYSEFTVPVIRVWPTHWMPLPPAPPPSSPAADER